MVCFLVSVRLNWCMGFRAVLNGVIQMNYRFGNAEHSVYSEYQLYQIDLYYGYRSTDEKVNDLIINTRIFFGKGENDE